MGIKFKGLGVALVSPFNQQKELDLGGLGNLLRHTSVADYWVVNGTTGESPVLTELERNKILSYVGEHNPKGLPIMFGIGGNNTHAVVQQIKFTNFSNIQAVLSVGPYYNKPTQEGIFQHYSMIADHCPVPIFVYNVPGRTACNIEADTILKLAEHPNIHGVKESSPDQKQWKAIGEHKPNDFALISGDDISTLAMMKCGGSGLISVMANVIPSLMASMVHSALNQRWYEAENILQLLMPINPLMYQESNPVGVKKALSLIGVCEPYVRLPLVEASDQLGAAIAAALPAMSIETKKP
jgi:4-hydroxy-tetrahydrodipicolinate synthase